MGEGGKVVLWGGRMKAGGKAGGECGILLIDGRDFYFIVLLKSDGRKEGRKLFRCRCIFIINFSYVFVLCIYLFVAIFSS